MDTSLSAHALRVQKAFFTSRRAMRGIQGFFTFDIYAYIRTSLLQKEFIRVLHALRVRNVVFTSRRTTRSIHSSFFRSTIMHA